MVLDRAYEETGFRSVKKLPGRAQERMSALAQSPVATGMREPSPARKALRPPLIAISSKRSGRALCMDRLATDSVANGIQNVDEVARLADLAEQGDP